MTAKQLFVRLGLVALGLNLSSSRVQAGPANASAACKMLESADFSHIPDALTQVLEAKLVDPSSDRPGCCQVSGYVAPSVGFVLRLPLTNWNGKLLELGCGGLCGSTDYVWQCDGALRRGYACVVSDGGHRGRDGKWAYNDLHAKIDFAYRAPHVTALASKAIVERYYGHPARQSYFMGCSGGGSQAMWLAQRFPWDFDGIVAGAPAIRWTESEINQLWGNRVLTDHTGEALLGQADLEVLHQAVAERCDLNDGIKDGLIGDPRACDFDPSELLCTTSKGSPCLTAKQIEAVKKIYSGPVSSKGETIVMPVTLRGSERTWLGTFRGPATHPRAVYNFVGEIFRYFSFHPDPGPTWNPEDFDFDRDYKRLGIMESLTEPINPDLRKFKAAGGKLLAYTGWADAVEGVLCTVDYYENAEKIVGGRAAAQDFFRLFVIPGMDHCTGGDGAFGVDYLSHLEAWVEKGQAPEKLIGSHVQVDDPNSHYRDPYGLNLPLNPPKIEFSRPVYPYPTMTKYLGYGDPKDAASFGPIEP